MTDHILYDVRELGRLEGQAADLVVGDHVDQETAAQQQGELAEVDFRYQDLVVAMQHVGQVRRERVEVPQVGLGDHMPGLAHPPDPGPDGAVGRAPAEHQDTGAAVRVVDLKRRDVGGDPVDLGPAQPDHPVMVVRVVGDRPDGRDEEHISRGIYDAYTTLNLRYSQLAPLTMFTEQNTGSNLPGQVEIYATGGDEYKFLFMAKGGGSANKSFLYQETKAVLNPARMLTFLEEKIRSLGTAACPPYHLAIVVGGTSAE